MLVDILIKDYGFSKSEAERLLNMPIDEFIYLFLKKSAI